MRNDPLDRFSEEGQELRAHGSAAFPVACYGGDWKDVSVRLHWHKEVEAGFVTSGQVLMVAGKERIILSEGEGFFINSGIPHAFLDAGAASSTQKSIVFDPILVGGRIDSIFWQRYVHPVVTSTVLPWCCLKAGKSWQDAALEKIRTAWDQCERADKDYELGVREALTGLMVRIQQNLPAEQPIQNRRVQRDNERIRNMLEYIQSNYAQVITVDGIAASASVSPSEALRCFHNTIGLTPMQYANHYRVQRAAEALRKTDGRIQQIGTDCGFQEMSYFAKTFRRIVGDTDLIPASGRSHMQWNNKACVLQLLTLSSAARALQQEKPLQ